MFVNKYIRVIPFKLMMRKNLSLLACLLALLIYSCSDDNGDNQENPDLDFTDLSNLPADTGGVHLAVAPDADASPYGYHIYLPSSYQSSPAIYPTLIFLHGLGEKGDNLDLVLRNGPPKLIEKNDWDPTYPMVVASPQTPVGVWNMDDLKNFINFIKDNYKVNQDRLYLTGLSLGGGATFQYLQINSKNGNIAAAVPIAGWGSTFQAPNLKDIPIWAFHGDNDKTISVNESIKMYDAINGLNPDLPMKLTVYPGVGHNSWAKTYDGTGMVTESNEYDPFSQSIYDWMFQYKYSDLQQDTTSN